MSKKKKKEEKDNSERWLLTYSDLITLLLALFILLYAMGNVDKAKYDQLATSLHNELGNGSSVLGGSEGSLDGKNGVLDNGAQGEGTDTTPTPIPTKSPSESSGKDTKKNNLDKMKSNFDNIIAKYYANKDVSSSLGDIGLVITFSSNMFFNSGDDTLTEEMKRGLRQIAIQLNRINNHILIQGNTDNVPTGNGKYSSNWQLSALRAANVAQYLVEVGKVDGGRLSAIGQGEYQPVASNGTEKGRNKNRRIEIIILNQ